MQEELGDIEKEEGNEDIQILVPFDPAEINIKIVPRTVGQLVELLEDQQILIPKYQRLPNLWNERKKSRFIESLMLELPIPLFYFDEGDDKKWYVVDGLQRMSTLEHFMIGNGKLSNNREHLILNNLEFLTEFNGKSWSDLPRDIKRRINSNQVTINLIGKGTPDEVKYTIFSRINQGDVPLTPQEIRTALFQGYRVDFLESLVSHETSEGQLFHKVTAGSVKTRRQEDLDFVSRFVAFYLISFLEYEPDLDRFITTGTKKIPEESKKLESIKRDFCRSLNLSYTLFGIDAFRKRLNESDSRRPINKPMFEVLSVAFAKLDDETHAQILKRKSEFVKEFINFQGRNSRFWNAISTGTATKDSVLTRNREFDTFLKSFLDD